MFRSRGHRLVFMALQPSGSSNVDILSETDLEPSSVHEIANHSDTELEEQPPSVTVSSTEDNDLGNIVPEQNKTEIIPPFKKIVDYSDDSHESSESFLLNVDVNTIGKVNPTKEALRDRIQINYYNINEKIDSDFEDSGESWKDNDKSVESETSSNASMDEMLVVGNRGAKKNKPIAKKTQRKYEKCSGYGKTVKPNPCSGKKCGHSCAEKFTEEDRQNIHEYFWGMASSIRQRDWILTVCKRKPIKRRRTISSQRNVSYDYVIPLRGENVKVCQQFLIKTLDISQMTLRYTVAKSIPSLNVSKSDERGRHKPHNKTDIAKVDCVKNFIKQLPAVPSHYCRSKGSKLYLPQEFRNISNLYNLNKSSLEVENKMSFIVNKPIFRKIFKKDFHLGFHLPKKDKCTACEKYKHLAEEDKLLQQETDEYKSHQRDKEKSKLLFLEDQKRSKEAPTFLCSSFDLQKVLSTPHGDSINLYYARKFSFYNETVYESGERSAFCFLWGESDGNRGCNEVCSILYLYLKKLDERKRQSIISLYCDSCAGQNRNRAMLAMISFFVQNSTFITDVSITFLLPGHTMMPVDSVHSTIESFCRRRVIWAPSEWATIIANSRTTPKNYDVITLCYSDFQDWKKFAVAYLPAKFKIKFRELRSAHCTKRNILLRYGYFDQSETDFININHIIRSRQNLKIVSSTAQQAYSEKLKISAAKYNDLKTLCEKGTIPQRFQHEYLTQSYDGAIKDTLPESDEEDGTDRE